jgi:hypothetical protein
VIRSETRSKRGSTTADAMSCSRGPLHCASGVARRDRTRRRRSGVMDLHCSGECRRIACRCHTGSNDRMAGRPRPSHRHDLRAMVERVRLRSRAFTCELRRDSLRMMVCSLVLGGEALRAVSRLPSRRSCEAWAEAGWEAGIRTPITCSRGMRPTVGRPPSAGRAFRVGGNYRL